MGYIALFFVLVIVAAIIVIIVNAKARKAMSAELSKLPGFSVTQEVMSEDAKTGFAFDDRSNKICLIAKQGSSIETRVMDYRDILSVEMFEDGESITKTSRGSQLGGALLGGIVFGPLGAVVGGLSGSKKSENKVMRIDLRLAVNDTTSPVHNVNFLLGAVNKSSFTYKQAHKKATHWSAIIEALIKRADVEDAQQEQTGQAVSGSFNISGRLRELAKLRDEGLLTEAEFAAQKTKLLDL